MPPKRQGPVGRSTKEKAPRQSALAKEHNISASVEAEIKECFSLFSTSKDALPSSSFRRALAALNIPASSRQEYNELLSAADPDDEDNIRYANFVAIAALKFNARGEEEEQREVTEGFELFMSMGGTGNIMGRENKITLPMLRKIAGLIKEDVSDDVLRDMMLEANGGAGVNKGVSLEEFEGVMRRAGVFK